MPNPGKEKHEKRKADASDNESDEEGYSTKPLSEREQKLLLGRMVEIKNTIALGMLGKLSEWLDKQPEANKKLYKEALNTFQKEFLRVFRGIVRSCLESDPQSKLTTKKLQQRFYDAFMGDPCAKTKMSPRLARQDTGAAAAFGSSHKTSALLIVRTPSELERVKQEVKERVKKNKLPRDLAQRELRSAKHLQHNLQERAVEAVKGMNQLFKEFPQIARFLHERLTLIEPLGDIVKADIKKSMQQDRQENGAGEAVLVSSGGSGDTVPDDTPPETEEQESIAARLKKRKSSQTNMDSAANFFSRGDDKGDDGSAAAAATPSFFS